MVVGSGRRRRRRGWRNGETRLHGKTALLPAPDNRFQLAKLPAPKDIPRKYLLRRGPWRAPLPPRPPPSQCRPSILIGEIPRMPPRWSRDSSRRVISSPATRLSLSSRLLSRIPRDFPKFIEIETNWEHRRRPLRTLRVLPFPELPLGHKAISPISDAW